MKWPWTKPEQRAETSSYTDEIVRAITSRVNGVAIRKPEATAALEACAGVIGRAFAMAEIDAPPWAKEALSPSCLLLIGRSLIKAGEVLFKIDMTPNAVLRLYPVADHNVFGSHDPQQWTYRVSLQGPSLISSAEQITSQSVLHFMYSTTASVPWRGQGPVQNAAAAGRLSIETATALADELSGPRGFVLPMPGVDGDDTTIDGLKSDIKTLSGQVATVESMSSGWNEGDKRTSPQGDWEVKRIGARPPEALIQLQSVATMEILSACGLSAALFDAKAAAASREAWRQLLFGVVAPLGQLVSEELSRKLETPISLGWQELRAADIQGRARSFKSLIDAGMSAADASAHTGLVLN